jgi:hypothetical protein
MEELQLEHLLIAGSPLIGPINTEHFGLQSAGDRGSELEGLSTEQIKKVRIEVVHHIVN